MKTPFAFAFLCIITIAVTACPGEQDSPGSATADDSTTTAATLTGDDPSTGDLLPTTSGDESSSGGGTTGPAPISCGMPAQECGIAAREWCEDLQDVCSGAGISDGASGIDYCSALACPVTPPCQACFFIASTCKQLGNGEDFCDAIMADCLCRAQRHDLDIDA